MHVYNYIYFYLYVFMEFLGLDYRVAGNFGNP